MKACRKIAALALCAVLLVSLMPIVFAADAAPATAPGVRPEDVMATLEKLGELKSKGILTQEEFDAKKTELLKKLI